jgi:hypothetical protein
LTDKPYPKHSIINIKNIGFFLFIKKSSDKKQPTANKGKNISFFWLVLRKTMLVSESINIAETKANLSSV